MVQKLVRMAVRHLPLLGLCGVALVPLYFMGTSALKGQMAFSREPMGLPSRPTLDNFAAVFGQPGFGRWMFNSVLLTLTSVGLTLGASSLAAYAFARIPFRARRALFRLTSALMAIPVIAVIVPLFVLMVKVGLVNTYPAAIVVYCGFMIPYTTFFLTGFFSRIPQGIFDAARMDGCSHGLLLRRIALPLSAPALVTQAIVNALWVWSELLISLVLLQADERRTLMVGLTVFQDRFGVNVPATMAGLCVAVAPILLLYVGGLRYFVSGLTVGAFKGE
jgi:ABC-type glycerol-3-phosphate transport system permease component